MLLFVVYPPYPTFDLQIRASMMVVFYESRIAKVWYAISRKYIAFTVGPLVFTIMERHSHGIRALLAHEAKHVEQWRRYWYIGFLPLYYYYTIRYGYWNNPLEKEARAAEHETTGA